MAEKKQNLKRTYNVPLRREFLKTPRYKRSKKAVLVLRQFISKHMKSDNVFIDKDVNELIWKHGIKNPPHHIKVDVEKDKEGKVVVKLGGIVEKKEAVKKSAEKKEVKKVKEKKKSEVKKEIVQKTSSKPVN